MKKLTKQQREVREMKARLPLAKAPVRKKLGQKTAAQLMPVADKWFSRYIRLRDCEFTGTDWVGECIDGCGRKLVVLDADGKWKPSSNNGHFISRGVYSLRFSEENCSLQAAFCNAWRDKEDMLEGYRTGLALKCGEDTVKELKRLSKLPEAYRRPSKPDLLQVISDAKQEVEYILAHKENYQR